jgi:general secretion pathway protein N
MIKKVNFTSWWIFALIAFSIFILLQIPASWLVSKFYKNNQSLQNVSGNIWQGQADWKKGQLRGSVSWSTRPLDLLLFRLGANIELRSGNSQLDGVVAYRFGEIIIDSMQGQISPETLKNVADWQWPTNSIQVKDLDFKYKKNKGFTNAKGDLQWSGGELIYTFSQRLNNMNVPSLKGKLADENSKLIFDVRDQKDQKMVNLVIDQELMMDLQLTQRLLLNVPSYDGKAGLDTFVISTRQPLIKGGA